MNLIRQILISLTLISSLIKAEVLVYSPHPEDSNEIEDILKQAQVNYKYTESIKNSEDLHIFTDISNITQEMLPANFICYIQEGKINESDLIKLEKSISVWYKSLEDFSKYQSRTPNCYWVPENCDYLSTVCLPCFLKNHQEFEYYKDLLKYSNQKDTDISSILPVLFCEALKFSPKTILELGVRGGESTLALVKASKLNNSKLIGVDIDSYCKESYSNFGEFFCMDDILFAKNIELYLGITSIDFIFIDTSHEYEHTFTEIGAYVSLLSENGVLAFHDSNVIPINNQWYKRLNNTNGFAFNVPKGVAPAIKNFFSIEFDQSLFVEKTFRYNDSDYMLIHYPYCNGLTIIRKI